RYPNAEGAYRVPYKMNTKLPQDECYLETECPRGQMGFYIVGNGTAEPLRARAKSSCFCNLSVTGPLSKGMLIADIPAIVGSLDIVMGEIARWPPVSSVVPDTRRRGRLASSFRDGLLDRLAFRQVQVPQQPVRLV